MFDLEEHVNEIQSASHTIYQNVLRVLDQVKEERDEETIDFKGILVDEAASLFTAVGRMELLHMAGMLNINDIFEMRVAVMDTFKKCDGLIKAFQETR